MLSVCMNRATSCAGTHGVECAFCLIGTANDRYDPCSVHVAVPIRQVYMQGDQHRRSCVYSRWRYHRRYYDRVDTVKVANKGPNDFVTEVDAMCERTIIDTVKKSYPDHASGLKRAERTAVTNTNGSSTHSTARLTSYTVYRIFAYRSRCLRTQTRSWGHLRSNEAGVVCRQSGRARLDDKGSVREAV